MVESSGRPPSDPDPDLEPGADRSLDAQLAALAPIGLGEAEFVALPARFERKYVVDEQRLADFVDRVAPTHSVLEIDGRRVATHSTVYFDTADLAAYRAHVQGRRRRYKVRTRHYGDPGAAMLEVKLKGLRGATVKQRCPHPGPDLTHLGDDALRFVESVVRDVYGFGVAPGLAPALVTTYRRTTLVDLDAGVRVTIDRDLRVGAGDEAVALGRGTAIVETKSVSPRPAVERMLLANGVRPQRLSKYCMGVVALNPEVAGNPWRRQMRRLAAGSRSSEVAGADSALCRESARSVRF